MKQIRIPPCLPAACVRALESYLSEWVAATVYVNFTPQETKTFPFSQIVDWQWTSRKEEIDMKTGQLKWYCIIKSRSNPDCCSCWMCTPEKLITMRFCLLLSQISRVSCIRAILSAIFLSQQKKMKLRTTWCLHLVVEKGKSQPEVFKQTNTSRTFRRIHLTLCEKYTQILQHLVPKCCCVFLKKSTFKYDTKWHLPAINSGY